MSPTLSPPAPIIPAARLALLRGGIDSERLRVLERGAYLLVMDRISGRWTSFGREIEPLLRLLPAPPTKLEPQLRWLVDDLRRQLAAAGVGVPASVPAHEQLTTFIIKLTSACNLACAYCYDYESVERARRLEAEHAVAALGQALDLSGEDLWVILHGGEPMLVWPLIEQLVTEGEALARARGKRVHFTGQTNLTRLNERIVEFSQAHDIVWGISIDGDSAAHDRFRIHHDGRGSHELFLQALQRFPRFVRRCGVMSTVTRANDQRLLAIARYFRDLGMASWDWSLFQPIGRGREQAAQFEPDWAHIHAGWDELFNAIEAGEFAGFAVLPIKKYLDNLLRGPGPNMCLRGPCGAARDLLSLSANGVIEACDCIDPNGPLAGLGRIGEHSLAQARESTVAQAIRSRDVTGGHCGDCIWYAVCGGTCMAHAGALHGVWGDACRMSQQAFDRISDSLLRGDALLDYARSLA